MRNRTAVALLAAVAAVVAVEPVRARQDGAEALREAGYARGDPGASILIVEFADFGCKACAQFSRETLPLIQREWIATGRASYVMVPYDLFRTGRDAASAAECAARQDAFWPMHDLLYERQNDWLGKRKQREMFATWAAELGLDMERFDTCQRDKASRKRYEENKKLARKIPRPRHTDLRCEWADDCRSAGVRAVRRGTREDRGYLGRGTQSVARSV